MRIWISGGGTGGHVYPALTVLDASNNDAVEVTWLGRADSIEAEIVRRHGLAYREVASAPIVGVGLQALPRHLARLARGTFDVWRQMGRERPDVVLVTGGYVTVPVALAARMRCVPLAIYLPDAQPGKAVRLIAHLAQRIAVTTAATARNLPAGKVVVTGYPVRPGIRAADRAASRCRLGLDADESAVLIYGGSQGARRLNHAVIDAAERLLRRTALLHVTGAPDHATVETTARQLHPDLARRWHVFEYLHDEEMAAALAAADLAVSRAGAATLGELPARALPAILVPLPIASGHQAANARVLVDAGAAVVVDDGDLDGDRLAREVLSLLDDPDRRRHMSRAAQELDRPGAAAAIWHEMRVLARPVEGAA